MPLKSDSETRGNFLMSELFLLDAVSIPLKQVCGKMFGKNVHGKEALGILGIAQNN